MNEDNIRQWVLLDERIHKLKQVIASLQKQQEQLEDVILSDVDEKDREKVKIQISSGGSIRFREIQVQPSISQTFLLSSLKKYFSNSEEANTILRFILNERVPKKKWIFKKLK